MMRIQFMAAAALFGAWLGGACPIAGAAAAAYPAIYVFGDSLSDAGNVYVASLGLIPISPPYSDGRFTNGPLWVQLLAAADGPGALGPSLVGGTDFAYGSASSGASIVHSLDPVVDLPAQLAQFTAAIGSPDPKALFVLWIGANDLFDILSATSLSPKQVNQAVDQVIENETDFVVAIRLLGARQLLVVNAPDLGVTPSVTGEGTAAIKAASRLSKSYNAALAARMATLATKYHIAISVVDVFTLLDSAIADKAKYHFTDVTHACWTGNYEVDIGKLCGRTEAGQNRYLFWDMLHPTARGHAYIAALARSMLPRSLAEDVIADARQ